MKITLFDPYLGKFTTDMKEWWEQQGHEVRMDRYYDPELVVWGDLIWFDTCDNNILSATNPGEAILGSKFFNDRVIPWDMHEMDLSNKKVVVRPIDIEVWQGHHAHDHMWDVVDHCIFIAPHIRDIAFADSRIQGHKMTVDVIPCGVDLDKWTFIDRDKSNNKVGIVAERWVSKGIDYAIQIAMKLPDYEFHWLGVNNDYHWEHEYLKDMIARRCPNLILEDTFVEDLNNWWKDKSYVLSCSHKEAFGYSIAEAMAKGVKPVIHEFYGYEPIWGFTCLTWSTIDQAVGLLTSDDYHPKEYRLYLETVGYTVPQMMQRIMGVVNG